MAIFEIIDATIHLYKTLLGLPLLTYLWYFNLKTLEFMLNYAHQFIKIIL